VEVSRRQLVLGAVAGAASAQQAAGLTAGQVIERIQKNVGVPWRAQTVDTIKVRESRYSSQGNCDYHDGDAGRGAACCRC